LGVVRIVGGRLRGRRLRFPDAAGLRPTADRVRETLFNWLAPRLPGAHCLDLFAGSGALGIEAASRGAAEVILVERARAVAEALRRQVADIGLTGVEVRRADALRWLQGPARPFDIVFLDPPFAHGLLPRVTRALAGGWLAPQARIYLEDDAGRGLPELPRGWRLLRQKRAGQVAYGLAGVDP